MKSPHTKAHTFAIRTSNRTVQSLQKSVLFYHPRRNSNFFSPSLQKKIKSPSRTVLTRTDTALNVNRFGQTVCRHRTTRLREKQSGDTHNKGLKEMAGEVVNQTFVLLLTSSGRLTVCASKPPLL